MNGRSWPKADIRRMKVGYEEMTAMRNRRDLNREFDGFDDPLVKVLGGAGIVLMGTLCVAVLLVLFVGMEFLGLLISVMWLLGAYAVIGAICGFIRGMQYEKANKRRRA